MLSFSRIWEIPGVLLACYSFCYSSKNSFRGKLLQTKRPPDWIQPSAAPSVRSCSQAWSKALGGTHQVYPQKKHGTLIRIQKLLGEQAILTMGLLGPTNSPQLSKGFLNLLRHTKCSDATPRRCQGCLCQRWLFLGIRDPSSWLVSFHFWYPPHPSKEFPISKAHPDQEGAPAQKRTLWQNT